MQLCRWASGYYHYSLGETLLQALPKALRQGKPASREKIALWSLAAPLDEATSQSLKRAHKQLKALQWLEKYPEGLSETELREVGFSKTILTQLQKSNGWWFVRLNGLTDCSLSMQTQSDKRL